METFGKTVLLSMTWLVVGDVECDASHCVIAARS